MDLPKYAERECKKHGKTSFILENRGYYRCKKCRSENVSKQRRGRKLKAIEYKGGQCKICGYSKCASALEFHHLDPNEKDFSFSAKGLTRSWEKQKIELDKCALLCSNCHKEVHTGVTEI
jgi:hypothetical protein